MRSWHMQQVFSDRAAEILIRRMCGANPTWCSNAPITQKKSAVSKTEDAMAEFARGARGK